MLATKVMIIKSNVLWNFQIPGLGFEISSSCLEAICFRSKIWSLHGKRWKEGYRLEFKLHKLTDDINKIGLTKIID